MLVRCTRQQYADFIDGLPNWENRTIQTATQSIMEYWRADKLVARSVFAKRVPVSRVKVVATYYIEGN